MYPPTANVESRSAKKIQEGEQMRSPNGAARKRMKDPTRRQAEDRSEAHTEARTLGAAAESALVPDEAREAAGEGVTTGTSTGQGRISSKPRAQAEPVPSRNAEAVAIVPAGYAEAVAIGPVGCTSG